MATNGRVPYPAVISTIGVAAVLIGGGWLLFESKLADVQRQLADQRTQYQWLYQTNRDERLRAVVEVNKHLEELENKISARGGLLVSIAEFKQFEDRMLDDIKVLREQLRVLEQTRPSNGELQATTSALRDRIEKLYGLFDELAKRVNSKL